MMNETQFQQLLQTNGLTLSTDQLRQFAVYYEMLVEWNKKMNLTAITAKSEVYEKHFFDSLTSAFYFDFTKKKKLCDVGAGAGFPSIPLKICFPHLHVTIVDSLKKRVAFLDQLVSELKLTDVHAFHERAESFGKQKRMRESFDVVTARAVARLPVLSELCLPLVKQSGVFLVMKGADVRDELADASDALALLGGKVTHEFATELPIEKSKRHVIIIRKIKSTPIKYPRKPGTPQKKPL